MDRSDLKILGPIKKSYSNNLDAKQDFYETYADLLNRNDGMLSCAACQEGNNTVMQSSDFHSWSSVHKKHTSTIPSWTQAGRPMQNSGVHY